MLKRFAFLGSVLLLCVSPCWSTASWTTVSPIPTVVPDWTMPFSDLCSQAVAYTYGAGNSRIGLVDQYDLIDMDSTKGTTPSPLIVYAIVTPTTLNTNPIMSATISFIVENMRTGTSTTLMSEQYEHLPGFCHDCWGKCGESCPPCQHPEASFVDIVASETLENGKGVYYVLVGWIKSLNDEGDTPYMYANLYKVLDDLTFTQLKSYEIQNHNYCDGNGDCLYYAWWDGGAVAVQRHSNSDHVYVFLSYSSSVPSSGCIADIYPSVDSSYEDILCNAVDDLAVTNLPYSGSSNGYYQIDMQSPYNTESETELSGDYAMITFRVHNYDGSDLGLYTAMVNFASTGGGSLSYVTALDTAATVGSARPRITTNPNWDSDGYLAHVVWNKYYLTSYIRRWKALYSDTCDWDDIEWGSSMNWPSTPLQAGGDYGQKEFDISLPYKTSQKPSIMSEGLGGARAGSSYPAEFPIEFSSTCGYPILAVERGNTTLNRVFGLWGDDSNDVFRARRLGGIDVDLTSLESTTPQAITGESARVFSFEVREGFADIVFKQIKLQVDGSYGDRLSDKVTSATLWLDRDENGLFSTSLDSPSIASGAMTYYSGAPDLLTFTVNGYFDSTSASLKERARFFVKFDFDDKEMDDGDSFQVILYPGTLDGVTGISAQTKATVYSPASTDPLIYAVEGLRDYLTGAEYEWTH